MAPEDIIQQVKRHTVRHVCVTGGEPLAQKACIRLLERLCDLGYAVSLETSGALDISAVDRRVSRVVDIKTPGSGEVARNLWANIDELTPHDQLKFVICDRLDYEWAAQQVRERALDQRCDILFSPSKDAVAPTELAQWILASGLPVRFQLQLHKILWNDAPGH